MHRLQRYILASKTWITLHSGTWSDCAAEQRITSGYTRIIWTDMTQDEKIEQVFYALRQALCA
jgi:hypothetical protein